MHTRTWSKGRLIDVEALYPLAATKEIVLIPAEKISTSKSTETGYSEQRYKETDTAYPLILLAEQKGEYMLIDGRHRYYKLLDSGAKQFIAVILSIEEVERHLVPNIGSFEED
jgi:hypothetical protein